MASKNSPEPSVETSEVSLQESVLLALADLIYATYGNSGSVAPVAEPSEPAEPAEPVEIDEDEDDEDEDVEEVDADDEVDIDIERKALMKESIAAIRKKLVDRGFDAADVKAEKSKSVLVDSLLDDLYGDDEDDEDLEDEDLDDIEDDIEDDVEDADEEPEDDEEIESDESDDDDEDDEPYTEDELNDMSLAELKDIAAEWEIEVSKGARAKTYVKSILEAQEMEEDADADADEDEYEEDDRAEMEALTLAELRKKAKEDYGLTARDVKGADKDAILDMIFESDDEDA